MGNLSVHCEVVSEILRYLFHYKTLNNNLELAITTVRYLKCGSNLEFPKVIIFLLDASRSSSGLSPVLIPLLAGSKQNQKKANLLNYYHVFSGSGLLKRR
jgi:hypothetical protein